MIRRLMRIMVPILVVGGIAAPVLSTQGAAAASLNDATSTSLTAKTVTLTYGAETAPNEEFTATVAASTNVEPTGTVTVSTSGNPICQTNRFVTGGATTLNWLASCSPNTDTSLPVGNDTVVARYGGDSTYAPSTSSGRLTVAVSAPSVKASLSVSPSSVYYGSENDVNLTASVSSPTGTPTGTVTFYDSYAPTSPLCTGTLGATGTYTCTSPLNPTALPASGTAYQLWVVYGGDSIYPSATSADKSLTVEAPTASVTLSVSPSSVYYGSENDVNLSASVSAAPGSPTGTVTFYDTASTSPLCAATLDATGTATCTSPLGATKLAVGSYSLYAVYGGTSILPSATSADKTLYVKAPTATVTLHVSPSSVYFGHESSVSFSATVASSDPGGPAPTGGTVTFLVGGKAICYNVGLGSGGTATCDNQLGDTQLKAGFYNVVAVYSNGSIYPTTKSTPVGLTVNPTSVDVSLSFSPASATYGQETAIMVTITVKSNDGAPAPQGYVKLAYGSTPLCTVGLASTSSTSSTASCSIPKDTSLPAGSDTLTASYQSSDGIYPNTKGTAKLTVHPAATSTAFQLSQTSVYYGNESNVGFSATVTGVPGLGVPTGAVKFEDLGTHLVVCSASLQQATSDSASASCKPSDTALGVKTWTDLGAVYVPAAGNNYAASTSSALTLKVEGAPPTVSLSLSPATSLTYSAEAGELFTVTVTGTTGANVAPTGTVTVYADGSATTKLCSSSASTSSGITSTWKCHVSTNTALDASAKPYSVYAAYAPDGASVYQAMSSLPSKLTVGAASTSTSLTITKDPTVVYGQEGDAVFTVDVTNTSDAGSPGNTGVPTGTVTVNGPNGPLCTTGTLSAVANGEGSATCSPTSATALDAATYTNIDAVYTANGNFAGSSSLSTSPLKVVAERTTLSISALPSSVGYGSENDVTFSVVVVSVNGQTPTGSVSLATAGGVSLCDATLTGGAGSCSLSAADAALLPVGGYTVDASYSGATDFKTSTASTGLTVGKASTSTALRLSSDTIAFGHEKTAEAFTVTVKDTTGSAPPTGTVDVNTMDFRGNVTTICTTGPLVQVGTSSSATASCSPAHNDSFDAGTYTTHSLYAVYGSTTEFNGSSSQTATSTKTILTVTPAPTTVKVWTNQSSVNYGNETAVTFHVKVSSPEGYLAPFDGYVTLSASADGTHWTEVCRINGLGFGFGDCPMPSNTLLGQGYYTVTASYGTYGGHGDFAPSTTPGMTTLRVDPGVTTAALVGINTPPNPLQTISTSPMTYGNEGGWVFSAKVADTTGDAAPSGTVTFTAGTSTVCTVALKAIGTTDVSLAQCSPTAKAIPPGDYYADTPLVATYNPPANGDWSASASPTNLGTPLLLRVKSAPTTLTVSAVPGQVNYGNEDTASFHVSVTSSAGTPAGSVTVTAGGVTLCTVTLSGGSGTCSPSSAVALAAGTTYTVTASYPGSTPFGPASSTTTLEVVAGTTQTGLSVTKSLTVGSEQDGNFAVQVIDTTGSAYPTGTVKITLTGTATSTLNTAPVLCTVKLVDGKATCSPTSSQFGSGNYSVTAAYYPTSGFSPSSAIATVTIALAPPIVTPSFTGGGGASPFSLFTPAIDVLQTAPTSASVATSGSASFASQLATSGQVGAVTFTTTAASPALTVSSTGAVTTTGTLSAGTYSVVGTDVDSAGNTGVWSFQLTVTSPSTVVKSSVTKQLVLVPQIAVASHNLVVHKHKKSTFTAARLTCSNADCHGTTWITQRQNHVVRKNGKLTIVSKIVVLGKTNYTVAAGKTHKQRIVLNATGKKVLGKAQRKLHPLRVVLHATVKGGHESARTVKVV